MSDFFFLDLDRLRSAEILGKMFGDLFGDQSQFRGCPDFYRAGHEIC